MACSAAKHTGPLPAGLKYNARQHRTLFREFFLNGAYCSHEALILSAKYGFVPMTQTVEDYDLLLSDAGAAELVDRPQSVDAVKRALVGQDEVYVYGGEIYRCAVQEVLARVGFTGRVVEVVGPNRGCCDHFSALQSVFYDMSAEA